MTLAVICGGLAGFGVFILVRMLIRPSTNVRSMIARIDAGRGAQMLTTTVAQTSRSSLDQARASLGSRLEHEVNNRGWRLMRLRSDLAVMNQPLSVILATKTLLAVAAFVFLLLVGAASRQLVGLTLPVPATVVVIVLLSVLAFFLPDLALHREAEKRRRDFRHVVGSFLDLVAMNLAGGRGLPEALMAAATIGDHWAMARIRQVLANARLIGVTPWEAIAQLGQDLGVEEIRDLASALALAGDEGAKIRSSLLSRAATLRRKELADVEGKAGERSQSMLVAQLLMVSSFLLFLAFPAAISIMQVT